MAGGLPNVTLLELRCYLRLQYVWVPAAGEMSSSIMMSRGSRCFKQDKHCHVQAQSGSGMGAGRMAPGLAQSDGLKDASRAMAGSTTRTQCDSAHDGPVVSDPNSAKSRLRRSVSPVD